jgi:hypothetical protein
VPSGKRFGAVKPQVAHTEDRAGDSRDRVAQRLAAISSDVLRIIDDTLREEADAEAVRRTQTNLFGGGEHVGPAVPEEER